MRANSPTNGFEVLNQVEDEAPATKITPEQRALVAAANTKDGKLILDHLQKHIDVRIELLKHGDFKNMDPTSIAVSVLASQQIISVFEDVLSAVELSKQAIKDASS